MKKLFTPVSLALTISASAAYELQADPDRLQSAAIAEASGLAASPADERFLWLINDSGNAPALHLSGTDGSPHGSVTVKGVDNIDWEDLSSFTLNGQPYLLIADTGDNTGVRESCVLYIIREPALPPGGGSIQGEVPVSWKIEFTFEGGPRDCEAVAVDAEARTIILISKRAEPPEVFQLPLELRGKGKPLIATQIGTTAVRAPAISLPIPFRHQPTGMDISADSMKAAVITYYGVFLFERGPSESWAEALVGEPVNLGSHRLHQAESVAFMKNGESIFAVSEGLNSPLMRFDN